MQAVLVSRDQQLGEIGSGWGIVMWAFNRVHIILASEASNRALHLGIRYTAQHQAFGTTLAYKQRIQNFIAECVAEIESLWQTIRYAAWLTDTGQDFGVTANIVKYLGERVASNVADKVLRIHGGAGYRESEEISRIYRDVRALRLLGGTDEIQQFAIARDAFKQVGIKIEP